MEASSSWQSKAPFLSLWCKYQLSQLAEQETYFKEQVKLSVYDAVSPKINEMFAGL